MRPVRTTQDSAAVDPTLALARGVIDSPELTGDIALFWKTEDRPHKHTQTQVEW